MKRFFLFVFALGLAAAPAMAQLTTGTITGQVVDDQGNALGNVTVVATSPALQGEREVTTDDDGRFNMPALPAGVYTLKATAEDYRGFVLNDVLVLLGKPTPVRITLVSGELVETLTVTSTLPLIESKTANTSVNLDSKTLDTIPTAARSFRDLTKYVPSITSVELNTTGAGRVGWPSIRGEGQYGDNYLIDGLTVRDPSVKTTGTPMPLQAIEQVQVITDGFSPEYGQALGGSINVITKTGSNDFNGEVAYLFRSDQTTAEFQDTFLSEPAEFDRSSPYVNLGGPIVKDKVWWFVSGARNDDSDTYTPTEISGFGTLPAGVEDVVQNTYFGKLSWAINSRHNLSGNYTWRDSEVTGLGASNSTPEARIAQDREDTRVRVNYQAVFTADSVLELKFGTVDRDLTSLPESGNLDNAQYRLTSVGVNTNNAWRESDDTRERTDYAAIYTQFFNPGGRWGSHELKAGFEYHEPEQLNGDNFSGRGEDVFDIGVNPGQPDFGLADTFDQGTLYQFRSAVVGSETWLVPTTLNEYRSSGILANRSEESGFFLQDRWEIGKWNILLGFRMDKQEGFNDADQTFFEYDYDKSWSPRASVTWDATGDGKNVFKSGWGRLYDVASTRFGEFANTREAFAFRTYNWVGGMTSDFESEKDTGSIYDIHESTNWSFDHEQSASSNPLDYSPVKRPAHADRFLFEYDRQVGNDYAFKTRYVQSKSRGLIEDIHFFYNDWQVVNTDLKRRDYNSFEVEFNGRPSANIAFNASYVHSSAKGTNPGQFEASGYLGTSGSGNNIGVFLDRPPSNPEGWIDIYGGDGVPGSWVGDPTRDYNNDDMVNYFDRDLYIQTFFAGLGAVDGDDDWYGFLPYSIDDQVKLFGRFTIPQWKDTYVTAFLNWASGYHTGRRGFQHLYGDYLTYSENLWFDGYAGACTNFLDCETLFGKTPSGLAEFDEEDGLPRGVDENSSFWTLDLSIGKVFNVGSGVGVEVRGEFFNVFNNQVTLAIQDRAVSTFGEPLTRQFPRSARAFVRVSF